MHRPEILVVAELPPFLMHPLQQHFVVHRLGNADLTAIAPQVRAIVATGGSTVDAALMRQLRALEIIAVMGVGYDGIDVTEAIARKVSVTHTPGVLDDDVADLALGLMLSVARSLPQADTFVRSGKWLQGSMPLQRKMSGSRLGIAGIGRIGQAIATRALAFGMQVSYTSGSVRPQLPYRYFPSVRELAAQSDFLVVATPGGASTRKLIGWEVLEALGPKGYLVNISRGSVVDQGALIEALEEKVIAGAALDVFENEPEVPARLCTLPNVVLTPHIGSATVETRQAMADLTFGNLQAHFAGQTLLTPVPECR
jgi:hydroxypyruvate reductase